MAGSDRDGPAAALAGRRPDGAIARPIGSPYSGPNKTVLAAARRLTHIEWRHPRATGSEDMNHRRIRNIFLALAVFGAAAAGAASAYATWLGSIGP